MKQARSINLLFLLTLIFLSCSDSAEVDKSTLAKAYVDLLVVEDFYIDSDSLEIKKEEIFNKYSLTKETYDSSFAKFSFNREEWDEFFNLANEYLDSLKSRQPSIQQKE